MGLLKRITKQYIIYECESCGKQFIKIAREEESAAINWEQIPRTCCNGALISIKDSIGPHGMAVQEIRPIITRIVFE